MKSFFVKLWAGIKKFVFDMFTDIRNNVDEKRFWGNILIGCGIVYAFINPSTMQVWAVSGGFVALGLGALGIAARADGLIGNIPPSVTNIINKVVDEKSESQQ
jgi:hypothetical protein